MKKRPRKTTRTVREERIAAITALILALTVLVLVLKGCGPA